MPEPTTHDHRVLFYADPTEVLPDLVEFTVAALEGDRRCLVVADPAQLAELRRTVPPELLREIPAEGRLVLLDAEVTLSRFMPAGVVDPELFDVTVGEVARSLAGEGGRLSAYSGMVGPLWRDGNVVGALELEQLWQQLQDSSGLQMLCAYPLAGPGSHTEEAMAEVCLRHSRVHLAGTRPAATGRRRHELAEMQLECVRRLLRTRSAEEAVGELMAFVSVLGGTTVSVFEASPTALPIDISLGLADPVLPDAPVGLTAREDIARLLPGLVEDARSVVDRAERLGHLAEQVDTDPLTGLGNRRGLMRVRTLSDADTVVMVDLDFFKRVNDKHGHEGGDRVLVGFSRLLRRHLRADDRAFRLGGEEFLLVLTGTSPEGALVALEDLRARWTRERPFEVTFSGGVAAVLGGDLEEAVQAADGALYDAKESGRDRFVLAQVES